MNGTHRSYTAPPITDAIIEIAFAEELPAHLHAKVAKQVRRNYEMIVDRRDVVAKVDFGVEQADFSKTEAFEELRNRDQTDYLALKAKSLVWQRLAPYDGWTAFIDRVRADLTAHNDVVGPRKIERIGMRYINRLDVPHGREGLTWYEDYLTINISLPDVWPGIINYAWRVEKLFPEQSIVAVIQSFIVAPEVPETGAFILDIDLVKQENLPVKLEDIFQELEAMRRLKNEVFELSITDKARGMFNNDRS